MTDPKRATSGDLVADDEGSVSRAQRDWARRKHYFLRRYMDIFANGMKYKWPTRTYVDLFAGPGRCYTIDDDTFEPGSPVIALDWPFTHHVYGELDRRAARALDERCKAIAPMRPCAVIVGDCNSEIEHIVHALPPAGLFLAFLDPTNWQVEFSTIERLTRRRSMDLLVTFMDEQMKRAIGSEAMDRFFGTTAYRDDARYLGPTGLPTSEGLSQCYRDQLEGIGYVDMATARELPVKNSKSRTIYRLAFFSKNPKGYEFWDKVIGEDETGQLAMLL